jgi:molecular chaperone HscB
MKKAAAVVENLSMPNLSKLNHFEKFSLFPDFNLDDENLENQYLQLQKKFHPDNLINQDKESQERAALDSITINEAYKVLKNPVSRAIYLLKLKGINIDEDNCEVKPDQETLMLILELKEKLFASNDEQEALKIKDYATSEIKKIIAEVAEIFKNQDYKTAAQKLIKVKYLDKILLDLKLKNQNPL